MAVEVDSVIVDLEARIGQYRANMLEAIGLAERFNATVGKPANDSGATANATNAKRSAQETVKAEEQATQQVSSTRKARTATAKQADAEEAASAKAAAKAKSDAAKLAAKEEATAAKEAAAAVKAAEREKQAAIAASERAMAQAAAAEARFQAQQTRRAEARFYAQGPRMFEARARELRASEAAAFATAAPTRRPLDITSATLPRAAGFENGQNPFQAAANASGGISAAQSAEMRAATAALAEEEVKAAAAAEARALAEAEANDLAIAMLGLKAQLIGADKADALIIQDQLFALRQIASYQARGITEAEAQVKVEAELLAIEERRAALAAASRAPAGGKGGLGGVNNFALGATGGRFGYSLGPAAIAGTAAFIGAGVAAEAIESSTKYAEALNQVSKSAGISTEGLQVYQRAALDVGVSQDQFNGALNTLTENLGKARTGSQEQAKLFDALGISIKGSATAGDLLPTLIDRISSISDPAQRARVEVGLFGEAGQKLDQMLSGGNEKVNDLAKALQDTGQILSSSDIARLDDTAKKLAEVKAQLMVSFAQVVADNAGAIKGLADVFTELAGSVMHLPTYLDNLYNRIAFIGFAAARGDTEQAKKLFNAPIIASEFQVTDRYGNPIPDAEQPNTGRPVQSGSVNQNLLNNLSTPRGRRGKSADQLANEADQRTKRFNDEMARAQQARLQALNEQESDEEKRRDAERQQIQDDSDKRIADLRTQAKIDTRKAPADARLIAARLDQAIAAEQAAASEKQNVVNLRSHLSAIQRNTAAENGSLEFKNQQLQSDAALARTAEDRRRVSLEILANQQKIAENNANEVLQRNVEGDPSITYEQVDAARRTLRNLPADTASKAAQVDQQTMGPWASYVDSLPLKRPGFSGGRLN